MPCVEHVLLRQKGVDLVGAASHVKNLTSLRIIPHPYVRADTRESLNLRDKPKKNVLQVAGTSIAHVRTVGHTRRITSRRAMIAVSEHP